jgi:hypothetical protein
MELIRRDRIVFGLLPMILQSTDAGPVRVRHSRADFRQWRDQHRAGVRPEQADR